MTQSMSMCCYKFRKKENRKNLETKETRKSSEWLNLEASSVWTRRFLKRGVSLWDSKSRAIKAVKIAFQTVYSWKWMGKSQGQEKQNWMSFQYAMGFMLLTVFSHDKRCKYGEKY